MGQVIEYAESADSNLDQFSPKKGSFDENSFNFTLSQAKPVHTEVLIASATFKTGENAGMPVPLNCTWYNMTAQSEIQTTEAPANSDFVQIPLATGACYQPSSEDIGLKVMVHAIPASDADEYEGMPMFAEVGPLEEDPEVSEAVREVVEN